MKFLNGTNISSQFLPKRKARATTPRNVRIRPTDSGLNTEFMADLIQKGQSPYMRDVYFYKNELRKAHGGSQIGDTIGEPVMWTGTWQRFDGITRLLALTNKNLYYYNTITDRFVLVPPNDNLSCTRSNRWNVEFFDDVMYFVNRGTEIRSWDGIVGNAHAAVSGGYAALTMSSFNSRLVLANTISRGEPDPQTVRWTQNGSVVFTGTGSGSNDISDRSDFLLSVKKFGAFRGILYKAESINEMRATGDASSPFDFAEITGGLGLLAPFAISEWPRGHVFVGNDEQIYNFNGSGFDEIGTEIRKELFDLLNYNSLDSIVVFFSRQTNEVIVAIPTGAQANTVASVYYAYDFVRKRWRAGTYADATWFATYTAKSGISWDEDVGNWDDATDTWDDENANQERYSAIVATTGGKLVKLDDSLYSFDGSAISFEFHSPDLIGAEDSDEITLLEVKIGYIVDGEASLTVDYSFDRGATFSNSEVVNLGAGGQATGVIDYASAFPVLTGQTIRFRIRNSNANEKVRIISVQPRISFTNAAREEATK